MFPRKGDPVVCLRVGREEFHIERDVALEMCNSIVDQIEGWRDGVHDRA